MLFPQISLPRFSLPKLWHKFARFYFVFYNFERFTSSAFSRSAYELSEKQLDFFRFDILPVRSLKAFTCQCAFGMQAHTNICLRTDDFRSTTNCILDGENKGNSFLGKRHSAKLIHGNVFGETLCVETYPTRWITILKIVCIFVTQKPIKSNLMKEKRQSDTWNVDIQPPTKIELFTLYSTRYSDSNNSPLIPQHRPHSQIPTLYTAIAYENTAPPEDSHERGHEHLRNREPTNIVQTNRTICSAWRVRVLWILVLGVCALNRMLGSHENRWEKVCARIPKGSATQFDARCVWKWFAGWEFVMLSFF